MATEDEFPQPAGTDGGFVAAATQLPSAEDQDRLLGVVKTIRRASRGEPRAPTAEGRDATGPLGSHDTLPSNEAMRFPSLAGQDERVMEDVIAARLFPKRRAPKSIGRYSVRRRLGKGGMGVVYEARDPELDRAVAIKLLLAGAGTPEQEERLRREARAMARVAHPNVAQVIEIGRHDGQTFVALEYVKGVSLDRWAAAPRSWREVVDVYIQAGRGLAAAHGAGVIHRDFKPHNTMIVEGGVDDGRVKVLDFGLARAGAEAPPLASAGADPAATSEALRGSLTRTGAIMGTPAYMSPEQFEGRRADERSDQYSFGASLYEALYGQLPRAGETLAELMRATLSEPVRPPPAASEVPSWVHRIVLRALARAPESRFASMDELCDALARDPRARRRRALAAVTVCAAIAGGAWGAARAGQEQPCVGERFTLAGVWDDARRELVTSALLATEARYAEDTTERVVRALDDFAGRWSAMRVEACEANQRGEQSDAMLDLRMACLDRQRAGVDALAGALAEADAEVLEKATASAQGLGPVSRCADVEALADERVPEDPALARVVASARARLAEAGALAAVGRYDEALARAEEELARARALEFTPLEAEAALQAGAIQLERRDGAPADERLSLAITAGLEARADRVVAEAMSRRVFVRASLLREAERALVDEPLARAYAARYPADGGLRWLTLNNVGVAARAGGDNARARELLEEAASIEPGPTRFERAMTTLNLGRVELDMGEGERAAQTIARGRAIVEETLGPQHPIVARALYSEGLIAARNDDRARASQLFARALEILGPTATLKDRGWPTLRLADFELHRRELSRALERASALDEELREVARPEPSLVYRTKTLLGDIYARQGDEGRARAAYESARALVLKHRGAAHFTTAVILQIIGEGYRRVGAMDESIAALTQALEIKRRVKGERHFETAETQYRLARSQLAAGRLDAALANARAARDVLGATVGEDAPEFGRASRTLALCLEASGASEEALSARRDALRVLAARLDAEDPELARARFELASALAPSDGPAEAEARALADMALTTYRSLGEGFAPERAAIEAWLAR